MKKNTDVLYAVVTGASHGIGFALTKCLLSNYQVIAVSRSVGSIDELRSNNLFHWQYDLSINSEREALIKRLENTIPHLNLLINSAGIQQELGFNIAEWKSYQQEIELNLIAPMQLTAGVEKLMATAIDPVLINIGSVLGFSHRKVSPIYSVTKAAIHRFSQIMHIDNSNVRVIEVIPPMVATNMTKERGHQGLMSANELAKTILNKIDKRGTLYVGKARVAHWLSVLAPRLLHRMINKSG
jgi:uncharacterized oxidoreductase